MNAPRHGISTEINLKWRELRRDKGHFETIADCAIYCLPGLRACAMLFNGNLDAGDDLVEAFLEDVLAWRPAGDDPRTPAGLTLAFEQFLRVQFANQSRRIALSISPGQTAGAWMTADEFFEAMARL
ncbi:hypothetical protein HNE_0590 [Hyphomonas neptunium ATCC 15444]|uniref:Uncharacterized protein n=2 Tax=Hyphomonas TaxID=85 RepID=Q0C4M4_HYPNA|nr:hypothetical protein HNE_0590 [Hyphomonas neptunium ATCC 15444]